MHLPIVQFSWHGLGSSGYTKEEVSQLELGYSNIGLSTFGYGETAVSQGIVVHGLEQIVSPSLQWILYGPALIDVNKGTSVRDITKRRLLITATPLQHKGY